MAEREASSSTGDEKPTGLWGQLPSFDPSVDSFKEFAQKARFLHGVFPSKDKGNLAPRLAMQCKGTAWNQVRLLDLSKLTIGDSGVEYLLDALSSWEETTEMQTFENFEKALYKVVQKSDEAPNSYALRLSTAFAEIGDKTTLKEMQAFVLLRQSALSNEDKKKVLTMAGGSMQLTGIEKAMRTLSTRVLVGSGEPKKKVYPTNYVDLEDTVSNQFPEESQFHSTYYSTVDEEEIFSAEHLDAIYGHCR